MLDSVRRETEPLPHEAVWLEGGQRYVVCAFYTDNYLPRALALMESPQGASPQLLSQAL